MSDTRYPHPGKGDSSRSPHPSLGDSSRSPHPFLERVTYHGPPYPWLPLPMVLVTDWYAPSPWARRGSPSPLKRMTHPRMMNGRHDAKCFILTGWFKILISVSA